MSVLDREFFRLVFHCLDLNILTLVLTDRDEPVRIGKNEVDSAIVLEYRKRLELCYSVHALAYE